MQVAMKIVALGAVALLLAGCESPAPSSTGPRHVDMRNLDEDEWTGVEANPGDPNCVGVFRVFDARQVASVTDGPPCRVGAATYITRRVNLR